MDMLKTCSETGNMILTVDEILGLTCCVNANRLLSTLRDVIGWLTKYCKIGKRISTGYEILGKICCLLADSLV